MATNATTVALVAILALVFQACTRSDQPISSPATPSPVASAVGFDPLTDWSTRTFEESLGQCMSDAGFEYFPRDLVSTPRVGDFVSREDAMTTGYGISTSFFVDYDTLPVEHDPNFEYSSGLSDAGRAAYDRAYLGTGEQPGCVQEVQMKLYGSSGEVAVPIQELIDVIMERMRADDRYVEAEHKWSECLADAGYSFASREEIRDDLRSSVNTMLGAIPDPNNPEVVTYTKLGQTPAFTALQVSERAIAVEDYDCSLKVGLDATEQLVIRDLEQRFLNENPGWIERMEVLQAQTATREDSE